MASTLHLVSKQDVTKHATVPCAKQDQPPLPAGSIRARTTLIGITTNNYSYAAAGTLLHWWDTYPVPAGTPAPYADRAEWGIVPAWGYAEVLESGSGSGSGSGPDADAAALPAVGSWLWGFWPTATHTFNLHLEPAEMPGHFQETSPHRSKLMPLYNRLELAQPGVDEQTRAWRANMWTHISVGYLTHRFTFAEDPRLRIHPSGLGEWSAEDADLRSSVVVVLSASGRTARGFI